MEGFLMTKHVDLFTPEEHLVLAYWLRVKPVDQQRGDDHADDVVCRWGFDCDGNVYSSIDAAVASIVLERVQKRLPQWAGSRPDGHGGHEVLLSRHIRARRSRRVVELTPQHLLSIDWGGSPGYGWPIVYNATWVPLYERYIVTASADGSDAYGACDFALGSFGVSEPTVATAAEIIQGDWEIQLLEHGQQRWGCMFGNGLITKAQATAMADQAWAEKTEEDLDDFG
jgi:hypothetical protein